MRARPAGGERGRRRAHSEIGRAGSLRLGVLVLATLLVALVASGAFAGSRAAVAAGAPDPTSARGPTREGAQAGAWEALRAGGRVAMIRHALAPGVGDPANFALGDCSTQRNLSATGRAQAARIGDAFRANGVRVDQVLSSAWCRCVDTALLAFGEVAVWEAINSFFADGSTERAQTEETRAGVARWGGPGTLVLVTHQVNITALTGIFPDSGEVVVLAPAPDRVEGFVVEGRVIP
jgi:phosphohistidine phosphatase SixA